MLSTPARWMTGARGVVAVALAVALVYAAGAGFLLTRSTVRLAVTNNVPNNQWVVELRPGHRACQTNVLLPKASAGVRVFVGTFALPGPRLTASIASPAGRVIRRGRLAGGYQDAKWQVIPFAPLTASNRGNTLCVGVGAGVVKLAGVADPNADNRSTLLLSGKQQSADISFQTVLSKHESLLELAPTIFHRAALFRPGWVGAWTYYLLLAILLVAITGSIGALAAAWTGRLGLPATLAVVAAVAFTNAAVWSLVMPAFNPPDEASHYAYVESLVKLHRRPYTNPALPGGSFSAQEELAIEYTALGIVQQRQAKPPWTASAYSEWRLANKTIDQTRPYLIGGGYNTTANYSPFYYSLEAVPYQLGKSLSIFGRLWLMRLLSAFLAAGTAAFVALLAREVIPSVRWTGLVAGLTVAFEPMFAVLGGAVNNDNLLFLFASLELYLLARIVRRGLTLWPALAAGAALGAGILAKPTMYALVPVALLAFAYAIFRDRSRLRAAYAAVGAAALGGLLLVDYLAFSGSSDSSTLGAAGGGSGTHGFHVREFLSYLWQWYLPPLPFMQRFSSKLPVYDIYFNGFWAEFGHVETVFPDWVYLLLVALAVLVVVLASVAVYRARKRAAEIVPQVLLLVAAVGGTALLVNLRSYLAFIQSSPNFAQGRYLLQVVGVLGVAVAGAAVAFGKRRGLIAGTALVVALAGFNLFSLGLVLTRYYT